MDLFELNQTKFHVNPWRAVWLVSSGNMRYRRILLGKSEYSDSNNFSVMVGGNTFQTRTKKFVEKQSDMNLEFVTAKDLEVFRMGLLQDIKQIIREPTPDVFQKLEGYKTTDVRKILRCSVNKLVSLRISRNLRTKKIGGTLYYNRDDIRRLLEEGF